MLFNNKKKTNEEKKKIEDDKLSNEVKKFLLKYADNTENIDKTTKEIQEEEIEKMQNYKSHEDEIAQNVADELLYRNEDPQTKIENEKKDIELWTKKFEELMNTSEGNRQILTQITNRNDNESLKKISDFAVKFDRVFEETKGIRSEFYRHCLKDYQKEVEFEQFRSLIFSFGKEAYLKDTDDKDYYKREGEFERLPYEDRTTIGCKLLPQEIDRLASTGLGHSRAEVDFLHYCNEKARQESLKQKKEIAQQLNLAGVEAIDADKLNKTFTTAAVLFGLPRITFGWFFYDTYYIYRRKNVSK